MLYGMSLLSEQVKVNPAFCVNLYSKDAECHDCLDMCPVGSVRMGKAGAVIRVDSEFCIGCERCVSACRYGVFRYRSLSEMQRLDSIAAKADKGRLIVSCSRSLSDGEKLNCLSQLNAVGLVYLGIKGVKELTLYCGNCRECALGGGKDFLRLQIKSMKTFSSSLEGCSISAGCSEYIVIRFNSFPRLRFEDNSSLNLGSDSVFSFFGKEIVPKKVTEDIKEVPENIYGRKKSQRKELFEKTASMLLPYIRKPLAYDRNIPYGTVSYYAANCDRCSLCITLCPSGALSETDGKVTHDPSYCTGCGVCVKTCLNGCLQIAAEAEYKEEFK